MIKYEFDWKFEKNMMIYTHTNNYHQIDNQSINQPPESKQTYTVANRQK